MTDSQVRGPEILDHDLNQYFPELLKFESTAEMEASPLWAEIREEAERVLDAVVVEAKSSPPYKGGVAVTAASDGTDGVVFTSGSGELDRESQPKNHPVRPKRRPPLLCKEGSQEAIKALAWNLERGNVFDGIVDALDNNEHLKNKDVLLLTELDYGMARSGNRFVAKEIAERLGLNYAFATVYVALQKGSGVESEVDGENTLSIHGLAMMSPWPMKNVHAVPLPNGKDKMWGKEKRLGRLRALIADIEHPSGTFRAVTVHLDAHCSRAHRRMQMNIILDHLNTLPKLPTLIGGDWNTTGFNSQSGTRAIFGYFRRVAMGPKNVALNHLPHPERYFERPMFTDIERRGYNFRDLNQLGVGTLHYDVGSIEKNTNLRDWVPEWCFPFIFWAAGRVGGIVHTRLDWFTAKGMTGTNPQSFPGLVDENGTPLSDHDPITVELVMSP